MGQHFISILAMLHIAKNKKTPMGPLYVLVEAVKLRFTGILLMFNIKLLII